MSVPPGSTRRGNSRYNEFGTDEFMEFCRRGSASTDLPQSGDGQREEARQWIEYCQGADSAQGRRRAANNRKALRGGRSPATSCMTTRSSAGTPEAYAARYLQFFRAIAPIAGPETPLLATGGEPIRSQSGTGFARQSGPGLATSPRTWSRTWNIPDRNKDHTPPWPPIWLYRWSRPRAGGFASKLTPIHRPAIGNSLTANGCSVPLDPGPQLRQHGRSRDRSRLANMLARNADWVPIANMTGLVEFGGICKRRART
jgi:hypothetical protein